MKVFFTALALLYSCSLFAQDLSDQLQYAEKLLNEEKYFDAVTEFKRLSFFDTAGIYGSRAAFSTGLSYKKGGFYSEAIRYFSLAGAVTVQPDSLYRIKVEIIKCNILRRTNYRALKLIEELDSISTGREKKNEINILRGFALVFADKWTEASGYFQKAGADELAAISLETEENKYSVTKAKILSAVLPGSGQIYTGEYLNGLISLAWNALSVYWTWEAFAADRIFDGLVIANFLWLRFYTGGINNAAEFAERNNLEITNSALKRMQQSLAYRLD